MMTASQAAPPAPRAAAGIRICVCD
eukprot:COSAG01_NODE_35154_length_536_cov_0.931350_1_plen_24_part_10